MLIVDTKNAPGAIGPYSQAYETNGLVITSTNALTRPKIAALWADPCESSHQKQRLAAHVRPRNEANRRRLCTSSATHMARWEK